MKKVLSLTVCALIILCAVLPVSAADTANPGLVITEVLRNPTGSDVYESFEIMNASNTAIDLYDYIIYFYCASGATV